MKIREVLGLFVFFEKPKNFRPPIEGGNIERTLDHVLDQSLPEKDLVLICGSYYIMAEVREYFGY